MIQACCEPTNSPVHTGGRRADLPSLRLPSGGHAALEREPCLRRAVQSGAPTIRTRRPDHERPEPLAHDSSPPSWRVPVSLSRPRARPYLPGQLHADLQVPVRDIQLTNGQRHADALRAQGHHHAGNGIRRIRESGARSWTDPRYGKTRQHRGHSFGAAIPKIITPSSCATKSRAAAPSSPPTSTIRRWSR